LYNEFTTIPIRNKDLEWKVIYVANAEDTTHDQTLEEVLVGPVPVGVNKFVLESEAPDFTGVKADDLLGVTVVLVTCSYKEQEFARVGYYVNNEYNDDNYDPATAGPLPSPLDLTKVSRHILVGKPRVTRFPINWSHGPINNVNAQAAEKTEDKEQSSSQSSEIQEEEEDSATTTKSASTDTPSSPAMNKEESALPNTNDSNNEDDTNVDGDDDDDDKNNNKGEAVEEEEEDLMPVNGEDEEDEEDDDNEEEEEDDDDESEEDIDLGDDEHDFVKTKKQKTGPSPADEERASSTTTTTPVAQTQTSSDSEQQPSAVSPSPLRPATAAIKAAE
jgi:histone chaperone ASF1